MLKILSRMFSSDDPISKNGYEIEYNTVLGSGLLTVVYRCRRGNEILAIKKIRFNVEDIDRHNHILREKQIWEKLRHPNIINLQHFFEGKVDHNGYSVIYQVMEMCETNLSKWFDKNANRSLDTCRLMINQISAGLNYLHGQNIMHRDLKPENILIASSGDCKIADFDITVKHQITEVNAHTGGVGSAAYAAPEQLNSEFKGAYNLKVDVYALGIILMLFFTNFKHSKEKYTAIIELRNNGRFPNQFFINFDRKANNIFYNDLQKLIIKMTSVNPIERPTVNEIIANYFI